MIKNKKIKQNDIYIYTLTHNTGALAALCAVDLQVVYNESSSTPKQVNLFTLGQPRVGNQDFSDFVWEQLPTATRVVHQNDVGKIFFIIYFHIILKIQRPGTRRWTATRVVHQNDGGKIVLIYIYFSFVSL